MFDPELHVAVSPYRAGRGTVRYSIAHALQTDGGFQDVSVVPRTPRRALVIDDDRHLTTIMALLLEAAGYDARVANSGADALELAESFAPHLVFLDINLGDASGLDVCRVIRRSQWGSPYVVCVSGEHDAFVEAEAVLAGCDRFVVKPLVAEMLDEILRQQTLLDT